LAAAFLAGAFAVVFAAGLAAAFLAGAFAVAFAAGLAAAFLAGAFAVAFAAGLAAAFLAGAFALALAAVFGLAAAFAAGLAAAFFAGAGFAVFFGATFAVTFAILTSSLGLILSFGFGICNLLCTVAWGFSWFTRTRPVTATLGTEAIVFFWLYYRIVISVLFQDVEYFFQKYSEMPCFSPCQPCYVVVPVWKQAARALLQ
jgi:hypothetical protein